MISESTDKKREHVTSPTHDCSGNRSQSLTSESTSDTIIEVESGEEKAKYPDLAQLLRGERTTIEIPESRKTEYQNEVHAELTRQNAIAQTNKKESVPNTKDTECEYTKPLTTEEESKIQKQLDEMQNK